MGYTEYIKGPFTHSLICLYSFPGSLDSLRRWRHPVWRMLEMRSLHTPGDEDMSSPPISPPCTAPSSGTINSLHPCSSSIFWCSSENTKYSSASGQQMSFIMSKTWETTWREQGGRPKMCPSHYRFALIKTLSAGQVLPPPLLLLLTLTLTHNAPGARPGLLLIWPHY